MTSLAVLFACAGVPWLVCAVLRASFPDAEQDPGAARERALRRYRRATLYSTAVALPVAAAAGAVLVDPLLATRWPTVGSWFFASLAASTAWVSLALARRTPEEREAMPVLVTIGRAVQTFVYPVLAVALCLLAHAGLEAVGSWSPMWRAVVAAFFSVGAVLLIAPWLTAALGAWPIFPQRIESEGASWRLVHLPAPTPYLTHAAALPWLRAVLISDGLFTRAPDEQWKTLVRYEVGGSLGSRAERGARWAVAIPFSVIAFVCASAFGANDPRKLVAGTFIAVVLTMVASWFANRQPVSLGTLESDGPSVQELAQTLRSLPPCLGQALPRTSHKPLGTPLYDRLFALGHDPGRRPHS